MYPGFPRILTQKYVNPWPLLVWTSNQKGLSEASRNFMVEHYQTSLTKQFQGGFHDQLLFDVGYFDKLCYPPRDWHNFSCYSARLKMKTFSWHGDSSPILQPDWRARHRGKGSYLGLFVHCSTWILRHIKRWFSSEAFQGRGRECPHGKWQTYCMTVNNVGKVSVVWEALIFHQGREGFHLVLIKTLSHYCHNGH